MLSCLGRDLKSALSLLVMFYICMADVTLLQTIVVSDQMELIILNTVFSSSTLYVWVCKLLSQCITGVNVDRGAHRSLSSINNKGVMLIVMSLCMQ